MPGAPIWVTLVLIGSIAFNYVVGLKVEQAVDSDRVRDAKRILALGVIVNVGLLGWFKYANFGVATASGLAQTVGLPAMPWAEILLPIGISFYTFHALSYLVDIYRGTARYLLSPIDYGLYIAFFPQLIAGPIVRFHQVRDQLIARRDDRLVRCGGVSLTLGWARRCSSPTPWRRSPTPSSARPRTRSTGPALLGLTAYTVQLYFDFSGYSTWRSASR
jgi:alginate O-acetyltransferase complex protein AlgI